MKKIISFLLSFALVFTLGACSGSTPEENNGGTKPGYVYKDTFLENTNPENPTVMGLFYRNVAGAKIVSDDPAVIEVNKAADEMLKKIEEYPDNITANGGKTYYLSNDGDDTQDGLTPETARRTYDSVRTQLKSGDALLFRRGDIFRGKMELTSGVSYGAYGEGVKPRIYGSRDGLSAEWVATDIEGVYEYTGITGDLSNIVFNSGEFIGRPIQKRENITRRALNYYLGSRLTLYSPDGNPGEIFHNIEIVDAYTLFTGDGSGLLENVKVQNLCVMYTGCHGFGALGRTYNFEVEGCIIGFCGGRDLPLGGISIGNGIEFWSVAENINIHDNYVFQCFDAGLTHQGPSNTVSATNEQTKSNNFTNINYKNNLLEYNTYDFEAFTCRSLSSQALSPEGTFTYNDVYITGNICRYTGWGWGSLDRPDKNVYATFKYDAAGDVDANGNYTNRHVKPLTIENNIFDRSRKKVLGISTPESNSANMILKNNQFLQTNRATIFNSKTLESADYEDTLKKYFGTYSGNTFKLIK